MKPRRSPKLDFARASVATVLARANAAGWPLSRLRAELRVAQQGSGVSRTTWRTAIVLVSGGGIRKLRDPRHAELARRKGRAA